MAKRNKKYLRNLSVRTLLKSYFFSGLFVVLPIIITFYLIKFTVLMVDDAVTSLFPEKYAPSNYLPYNIPGAELVAGIILVILIGALVRNYVGATLVKWTEDVVNTIPGVRGIYGAVKQVIDTVSVSNSTSFREVVLVEYPRAGLWVIAFVTGETKGEIQNLNNLDLVNVFLPTTPNPTSGFLLFVPRKDLKPLNMSVEQGLKLVISAGIITPSTAEGLKALEKQKKKRKNATVADVPSISKEAVEEVEASHLKDEEKVKN